MDTRGPPRVKNKAAAPVQISAEQLLREAVDRQEGSLQTPTQRFADLEELNEFRARKRREFEDYVRRNRVRLHNWLQYAQWELEQKEFARARSVFERALDVHPNNTQLWIRYIEAELKNRNVNHAKNLLDRAVTRLPRVNSLWFKYVYVQEILGDIEGTRQVFDRWMQWRPDEAAFAAYLKLEKKYGELDRAREVLRAWTFVHPEPRTWMKWAKFEQEYGTSETVREVFQTAIQTIAETLGDEAVDERIFIAFANFEARCKEYERARAIYNFALDALPRSKSRALHENYVKFQKQVGDKDDIEDVVITKRRRHYEEETRRNPRNYDAWIDFARLEESGGHAEKIREVYEKAISNLPPTQEKRHWRRFIFLWIFYAIWEELGANDISRAREVYKTMVDIIPHKKFTFAKAWVLWAQFELRHGEITSARKILGRALGICPKDKLFSEYIALETKLYEFARCRKLYEKWLLYNPANSQTWTKWAQLELGLDDADRARAIFELAVNRPVLDMPEVVWKAYIDFEEEEGEYDKARALYERLLEKADHPKVWISYAIFEINIPENDDEETAGEEERPVSDTAKARARSIFERAHKRLREKELKAERVSLLKAWLEFERTHGSDEDVEKVQKQQPRQTRKKRRLDDGTDEEYIDWIFPADDQQSRNLANLLAMANAWKQAGGSIAGGGA